MEGWKIASGLHRKVPAHVRCTTLVLRNDSTEAGTDMRYVSGERKRNLRVGICCSILQTTMHVTGHSRMGLQQPTVVPMRSVG